MASRISEEIDGERIRFGRTASHDRSAYQKFQRALGEYYIRLFGLGQGEGKRVLDVGAAEGGTLQAFVDCGYQCTGLEYSSERTDFANLKTRGAIRFLQGNIEDFTIDEQFDLVLLMDVIEHVQDKEAALASIRALMAPAGLLLVTFPPFPSAFGGHQQVMTSVLKYIPFFHNLPRAAYLALVRRVEGKNLPQWQEIHERGLTAGHFERMARRRGFAIERRLAYVVRPRQALRFGWKIRRYRLPFLRSLLATGSTYLLRAV